MGRLGIVPLVAGRPGSNDIAPARPRALNSADTEAERLAALGNICHVRLPTGTVARAHSRQGGRRAPDPHDRRHHHRPARAPPVTACEPHAVSSRKLAGRQQVRLRCVRGRLAAVPDLAGPVSPYHGPVASKEAWAVRMSWAWSRIQPDRPSRGSVMPLPSVVRP